ncbi:MAG: hypothetical protein WBC71_13050 [Salaquimonas sp.]
MATNSLDYAIYLANLSLFRGSTFLRSPATINSLLLESRLSSLTWIEPGPTVETI